MILEASKVSTANAAPPQPGSPAAAPPQPSGAAVAAHPAAARVIDASVQAVVPASASRETLREMVAAADRAVKALQNSVELSLDATSGEPIVRVVDTETGELIRQIPTEEMLELRRALDRIAGLLIQRKA